MLNNARNDALKLAGICLTAAAAHVFWGYGLVANPHDASSMPDWWTHIVTPVIGWLVLLLGVLAARGRQPKKKRTEWIDSWGSIPVLLIAGALNFWILSKDTPFRTAWTDYGLIQGYLIVCMFVAGYIIASAFRGKQT